MSEVKFLPISPGLLISMAIRHDHSFGMQFQHGLEEKQINLIYKMAELYKIREDLTDRQLLEEITGEGFYSFEREHIYREWATPAAFTVAADLATSIENDDQHDTQ